MFGHHDNLLFSCGAGGDPKADFETAIVVADEMRRHAVAPALGVACDVVSDVEPPLRGAERDGGRVPDIDEPLVERQAGDLRGAVAGAIAQSQRDQPRRQPRGLADRVVGVRVKRDQVRADVLCDCDLIEHVHHAPIVVERRLDRGAHLVIGREAVAESHVGWLRRSHTQD